MIINRRTNLVFKATINPKLFTGINDYISAAAEDYIQTVETNFNQDAKKISPILGTFSSYALNRIDYCVNFDLKEMGIKCSPDKMMKLIERADILIHFTEWTVFSESSRRYIPQKNSFYLKNNSVNTNAYWKGYQLHKEYLDCHQINDALNVILFEIQCEYPKVYNMSRIIKNNMEISQPSVTIRDAV